MFGRRQRHEELQAIQTALAADADARTALAQALTSIDARLAEGLEQHAHAQAVTDATVQHLRSTAVETRNDLALAVEHLAFVCASLGERIEAERIERHVLVEAITQLASPSSVEPPRSDKNVVLGGRVFATATEAIDLDADHQEDRPRWG